MNIPELLKYINKCKKQVDQSGVPEGQKSILKMEVMETYDVLEVHLQAIMHELHMLVKKR